MSRVLELAKAGRSAVAKFHELRLKYWNSDVDAVCCFEGSDDIEFYLPRVRGQLPLHADRIDFINCGGKGVVLTLNDLASERGWNLTRLAFFVDADLEPFLSRRTPAARVFVTDYYSIESYSISDQFFNSVWQDSFRLSITDGRRHTWLRAYQEGLSRVAHEMLPLFYAAVAIKRAGGGVEFAKVKVSDFITVASDGSVRRKTGRSIDYAVVFIGTSDRSALRSARQSLKPCDHRLWLRGKFALAYAMLFFSRMKAELGSRAATNRAVVKTHFNDEAAISCLCARVAVPSSLQKFLGQWAALIVSNGVVPYGTAA